MNTSSPRPPVVLRPVRSVQRSPVSRARAVARVDARVVVWVAVALVGGLLGWLSVLRYLGYNAGMLDLGNMAQAIQSVGRGRPLVTTFPDGSTSRLAVHVELIYFLLALPYMLWSDPRLLLIVQAALFASAALPVYTLAWRRSGSAFAATCLAIVYLLYPAAQNAVLFDFHGDTLAMPLLLWALDALDRRAWRRYAVFLAPALLCKFYVAVPVVLLGGIVWWCYGERRAAILTSAAGIAYGAVAFLVVRPLFTTASTATTHRGLNYLAYYFGQVETLFATADQRAIAALVVFGPALVLLVRGWRFFLPALPVGALVLLSSNGSSFDYRFHHYALVVPFIFFAAAHGLAPRATGEGKRRGLHPAFLAVVTLLLTVAFGTTFVNAPLNPRWWANAPGWGMDGSSYGVSSRDRVKSEFLQQVPPLVPVAASTMLAPHIAERDTLYSVRYPEDAGGELLPGILPQVDDVIADALFDYRQEVGGHVAGGPAYERTEIGMLLRDPAFGLVSERDGLLLFRRDAPDADVLAQRVQALPSNDAAPASIALANTNIELIAPRRVRATFDWIAPAGAPRSLVAISRLRGVPDARIVHLPTYALLPTTRWQPGQHIRETFDVELPADLAAGTYTWETSWHDLEHIDAYRTDAQSQIGPTFTITTLELP